MIWPVGPPPICAVCRCLLALRIGGQLQVQGHWQGELPCRRRSGHDVSCMVTITAVRSERAALQDLWAVYRHFATKQAEADIRQLFLTR